MSVAVDPRHTDAIGTHLRIETSDELMGADALERLTRSLLEHIVIRVTAAEPIDPAAIAGVARTLGNPPAYTAAGARSVPGHEIIGDLSARARPDDGRPRIPAAIEALHQDFGVSFRGFSSHSILYTKDVPTVLPMRWVSLSAAYASLPDDVKARIGPLRAVHASGPDRTVGARRPMVLRHPATGQPVLHLPLRRDAAIEDVDDAESEALMKTLWEAVETSPARYEHVLESGDLFIWDNVASVHDNPAFPRDEDRVVWFLTVPCETKVAGYGRAG
jgi:alpha-ketoglutarate-dependent taurine dioxygenase